MHIPYIYVSFTLFYRTLIKKTLVEAPWTIETVQTSSLLTGGERESKLWFHGNKLNTPFNIYIYDLPSEFNEDIVTGIQTNKLSLCYDLSHHGIGKETINVADLQASDVQNVSTTYGVSVRKTHMYALEIILHHKLLRSPYRTLNPWEADLFYIPFYSGLLSMYNKDNMMGNRGEISDRLFRYLHTMPFLKAGRSHFTTSSRPWQYSDRYFRDHPAAVNVTYICIEKRRSNKRPVIVAPYPSFIHLTNTTNDETLMEFDAGLTNLMESNFRLKVPSLQDRNVFLLLACGMKGNTLRKHIMTQFPVKTMANYEEYFKGIPRKLSQMWLYTDECSTYHQALRYQDQEEKVSSFLYTIISWTTKSVFCVQPPGDSPTRKSFYDSILSGCIPVLFKLNHTTEYPFEEWINYKDITYIIDEKLVLQQNQTVLEIVRRIPRDTVARLHDNILRLAKWLQYSASYGAPRDDDAFTLILEQVRKLNRLK